MDKCKGCGCELNTENFPSQCWPALIAECNSEAEPFYARVYTYCLRCEISIMKKHSDLMRVRTKLPKVYKCPQCKKLASAWNQKSGEVCRSCCRDATRKVSAQVCADFEKMMVPKDELCEACGDAYKLIGRKYCGPCGIRDRKEVRVARKADRENGPPVRPRRNLFVDDEAEVASEDESEEESEEKTDESEEEEEEEENESDESLSQELP